MYTAAFPISALLLMEVNLDDLEIKDFNDMPNMKWSPLG